MTVNVYKYTISFLFFMSSFSDGDMTNLRKLIKFPAN